MIRNEKGTFIINPYVSPYFNDKPNPNYKSMYLYKSGQYAKCLAYTGEIIDYYYKDIIEWETDGVCNCKEILSNIFGIENDKWRKENSDDKS